jgi:V8-like Glu-specific endopeptidase
VFNNCLTLSNSAHPGVSGGPVLNSDNKVVGYFIGGKQELHYCNIVCAKYFRRRYKLIDDK